MAHAALPATCGAGMEVPDRNSPWLPVPTPVEKMLTPGAVMSGFRCPSPPRGPPELKPANARNPALGLLAKAIVALSGDGAPVNAALSLCCNSMKGMVTPGMAGLKKPAALLTTPIATAPAAIARLALATNVQVPRDTITSAPAAPLDG